MNCAMTVQRTQKRQRDDPRVPLLKELSDPTRLRVVDHLGNVGPATVTELGEALALPLPQLSNHLKRLRDARIVRVEKHGRHSVYELADPGLQALLPVLDRITGRITPSRERPTQSRTCYEHLAGHLGVSLFSGLLDRGAIRDRPDGTVSLGERAQDVFGKLGVDPGSIEPGRRRYAFECFDSTAHAPHLAGALGDELATALDRKGWIELPAEGRDVRVTKDGARGFEQVLGVTIEPSA
jgi:DNA-binding transcriptional ArsR family regulator